MFNLNHIVSDKELYLEFVKQSETQYEAFNGIESVGTVTLNGLTFNASSTEVFTQYKLWLTRPERTVGKKVDIDVNDLEGMQEVYEELFVGAYFINAGAAFDVMKARCEQLLNWLRSTDFFTAPASSRYHESFPGGLLIHTLRVYNAMVDLCKTDIFGSNVYIVDATIIALVHDWCKIYTYETYLKNVKNDKTGQWEKVTAYTKNPKGITLGHGVTSMYFANKCFHLTPEMAAAIRWHQGRWNCCPEEMDELQRCNEQIPLVHLIQFADQLSITQYFHD